MEKGGQEEGGGEEGNDDAALILNFVRQPSNNNIVETASSIENSENIAKNAMMRISAAQGEERSDRSAAPLGASSYGQQDQKDENVDERGDDDGGREDQMMDDDDLDHVAEEDEDENSGGENEKKKAKPRRWTDAEDAALVAGVEKYGERRWKAIASGVGSRDHMQCLQRWKKVIKRGLAKGQWTREEDEIIRDAVRERNNGYDLEDSNSTKFDWPGVASKLPLRSAREVRERWKYALSSLAHHRSANGTPSASPAINGRSFANESCSPDALWRNNVLGATHNIVRNGSGASLMTPSLANLQGAQTPCTTLGSPSPGTSSRYIGGNLPNRPPAYPSWTNLPAGANGIANPAATYSTPPSENDQSFVATGGGSFQYHHQSPTISAPSPEHLEARLLRIQALVDNANAEIAAIRMMLPRVSPQSALIPNSTNNQQLHYVHQRSTPGTSGLSLSNTNRPVPSLHDSSPIPTHHHHHQGQQQSQFTQQQGTSAPHMNPKSQQNSDTNSMNNSAGAGSSSSIQPSPQAVPNSHQSDDSPPLSNNQSENETDPTARRVQQPLLPQAWPLTNRYQHQPNTHMEQSQQHPPYMTSQLHIYDQQQSVHHQQQQQQHTNYYSSQQLPTTGNMNGTTQNTSYVTPPQHYYNYAAHHHPYPGAHQPQQPADSFKATNHPPPSAPAQATS